MRYVENNSPSPARQFDPTRIKVLHLASNLAGGAGIATRRIHSSLCAEAVDSLVITVPSGLSAAARIESAPRCHRSWWHRAVWRTRLLQSPSQRWQRLLARSSEGARLELFSNPLSDYSPETHAWFHAADIVHLHWTAGLVDWPRLGRALRVPLALTLHDQEPYLGCVHYQRDLPTSGELAELNDRCLEMKRAVYRRVPCLVMGNSEWNTEGARRSGVFGPETLYRTIYYPLDTHTYRPGDRRAARDALELPRDRLAIGFACEDLANTRKGLTILMEALRALPDHVAARFLLVSFGNRRTLIDSPRPDIPWVHLGRLDSPILQALAYRAMDAMIVPSLEEAFGQTAIEALACGTPVIASDTGGLREALFDGAAGTLVAPGDPGKLRLALEQFAHRAEEMRHQALSIQARIQQRHSPSLVAAAHRQAYAELLPRTGLR